MRGKRRRFLSVVLAALMILTSAPVSAFAATDETQTSFTEETTAESFQETQEDYSEESQEESGEEPQEEASQEQTKVSVDVALSQDGASIYQQQGIEISKGIAASYGFTYGEDVGEDQVTPLDVLVQAQIDLYGATQESIQEYLSFQEDGTVDKINGLSATDLHFTVNGQETEDQAEQTDLHRLGGYGLSQGDQLEMAFETQREEENVDVQEGETPGEDVQEEVYQQAEQPQGQTSDRERDKAPTIETTLTDGMVCRGAKKSFEVIAKDADGNSAYSSVKFDGSDIYSTWTDDYKSSYLLNFTGMEEGPHTVEITAKDKDKRKTVEEFQVIYQESEPGELIGYATFDIEALTINCGYIAEPVKVPIYEGETAAHALVRVIEENGYGYNSQGTPSDGGFYLSAILGANAEDPKGATKDLILDASLNEDLADMGVTLGSGTEGQLGAFDYASGSGWMYCLNDVFANVGFGGSYLSDGDVVRTQFTLMVGADIGDQYSTSQGVGKVRANKDALATQIATVNSAYNKESLLANSQVRAAYEKANSVMTRLAAPQEEADAAAAKLQSVLNGEKLESVTLNMKEMTLENGSSKKLEVESYSPSDPTVPLQLSWKSSDESVATVGSDGTVTAKGAGTATITAEYYGVSAQCQVTVPQVKTTGITFQEKEVTLAPTEERVLAVDFTPANTTDKGKARWTTSDPMIAAVDEDGTVLGVQPGTATVAVDVDGVQDSCQVTVAEIPITGIDPGGETNLRIPVGTNKQLPFTVLPENTTEDKEAVLISANPNIVMTGGTSQIRGVAEGETDVIVRAGDSSLVYHVTVGPVYISDFTFSKTPETMVLGSGSTFIQLNFQPVSNPTDEEEVQWTTSDAGVVKLSKERGRTNNLTAVAEGTATITASVGKIRKSFQVTVEKKPEKPVTGLTLSAKSKEVYLDEINALIQANVTPAQTTDKVEIQWSSSDPSVLPAPTGTSTYGYLKPLKAGTATVTATLETSHGTYAASCQVTVHAVPELESIEMDRQSTELGMGKKTTLDVVLNPSKSAYDSTLLTWSSSDEQVATVDKRGSVTGVTPGTATITATYDGRLEAACQVTVVKIPLRGVSFQKKEVEIKGLKSNANLYLNRNPYNYTGEVTVTAVSSDESVAEVTRTSSNSVTVKPKKTGTATITVTVESESGRYTADCQVRVNAPDVESLAFPRQYYDGEYGSSLGQVKYVQWPKDGEESSITWKSSDESVATVTSKGRVKAVGYGKAQIIASLTNGREYSYEVRVAKPVTDITISASRLGLVKGGSISLEAIDFQPSDGDMERFLWASSNTDVLTVKDGLITAVGEGTATIYGTAGSVVATCEITVTKSKDEAAAVEVMGLIDQIGEVTLDSAERIEAARTAYDELTRIQKAYVENEQKLLDAEKLLVDLRKLTTEPVGLKTAKSVDYCSVELSWEAMSGAEGYRIYRKTPGKSYRSIAEVEKDVTSYRDSGLATGTSYVYTVRAIYTLQGERKQGPYVKAGITAKAVPEKGVITKAQSWGYQGAKVTWEPVEGADGYRLYCREGSDGKWEYVTQTNRGNATSYVHNGLTAGRSYTYWVRAYRVVDGEKVFGSYSDGKSVTPVPTSVKNVEGTSASRQVKLSWDKVNGASGYRVYYRTTVDGAWKYAGQTGSSTYTHKGLKKGQTLYYKVRAYRTVDGEKVFGGYSAQKAVKVK